MDDGMVWDALKVRSKIKFNADREKFLSEAETRDDGEWVKHTQYHWSRSLAGKRLDFWPSRKKWQYEGVITRGDIYKFISRKNKESKA